MVALSLPACVTRTLRIETNPPGARILLDGKSIGHTPVEQKFEYFGVREIVAELDGYSREVRIVPIEGKWYDSFPFDFFTEFLPLFPREDLRTVAIQLRMSPRNFTQDPQLQDAEVHVEKILDRASKLRKWTPNPAPPSKP